MSASQAPDHEAAAGEEHVPSPAAGLATKILAFAALVLILITPFATRPRPPGRDWFLAPAAWPLTCLGLTVVAGAVLALRFWRDWQAAPDRAAFGREASSTFDGMRLALEHALWFCLYLYGVSYLGFALATFVYLQFVVWRVGLRDWLWAGIPLLVTIGLVLIFRVGIGVWFPLAPIFRLAPDWIANTLGGVL